MQKIFMKKEIFLHLTQNFPNNFINEPLIYNSCKKKVQQYIQCCCFQKYAKSMLFSILIETEKS